MNIEDAYDNCHMGMCGEKTAAEMSISKADQDKYAIESYRRSAEAWKSGAFAKEIVPVTVKPKRGPEVVFSEDEEYKKVRSPTDSLRRCDEESINQIVTHMSLQERDHHVGERERVNSISSSSCR